MDHAPTPFRLGPGLLDFDALAEHVPAIRAADPAAPLVAEVTGLPRLSAPVLQVLLSARAQGREVRIEGGSEGLMLALATLGLGSAFGEVA